MIFKPYIYLLGIGGIGMSALARYFKRAGHKVAGYDRWASPLCRQLEAEGMSIHYEDNPALIPPAFRDTEQTLVIYTPAIPAEHREKIYFETQGFPCHKRAEILGALSQNYRCLAVAGTHGKTTTSTLLAHILRSAQVPSLAFLGGIAADYNTNFWGNPGDAIMVTEADEYDRSFLQLMPETAVITGLQADHLDVYKDADDLKNTFLRFAGRATKTVIAAEQSNLPFPYYGWSEQCRWQGSNVRIENHQYVFDLEGPDFSMQDIKSPLPGKHNLENIMAAVALASAVGVKPGLIKKGIENFRGIKRRFEYHISSKNQIYIDDYAHHPDEIRALLSTVKALYPKKKLTVIFQPHLFSRTRDFMLGFAESLLLADFIYLLPVYPAREKAIPGIDSEKLATVMGAPEKTQVMTETEILDKFKRNKPQLLLTVGAGNIDQLIHPLKKLLLNSK